MSRLRKRVRIGKYAIPVLLLITLAVGTVTAVLYVILTSTTTVTVVANPNVSFYDWSSSLRTNTFSESFDIFPAITTIQTNASNGIYSETASNVSIRISAISNTTNIESVNVTLYDGGQLSTIEWTFNAALPQVWSATFETTDTTYYTIWMEVEARSVATAGFASIITVDMKVENP